MTSRRAGYDSLVRRHQLESLLARSFDDNSKTEAQDSKPEDKKQSEEGATMRRAYGNEEVGRIASAIEESVPWSAGIFDLFWQRIDTNSTEETGLEDGPRVERPRPEK